jgi:TPR repeat protein
MKMLLRLMLSFVVFSLGAFAQEPGSPPKPATSAPTIADLQRNAQAGDAAAQYQLALHYFNGHGVSKDDAEGLEWLRKAAEAGHSLAQVSLGLAYRTGYYGIKEDMNEAVKWLRRASDARDAHGQSELGFMYERGDGVTKDAAEAVRLYALAADQGLPIAQFDLAYMYENGSGVSADTERAVKLYEKAAIGVPTARFNLAVLYSDGKSVPRDSIKAYMWGVLAASAEFTRNMEEPKNPDSRFGHALILLEKIAKGMSKNDKKEGRSQATEWINSHANQLGKEPHFFPFMLSGLSKNQ